MIVSQKKGPYGTLLVVTDSNLIGKTFEEGRRQLDLTKNFYKGEERNKEEVKILIPKARDISFTGKESVAIGIELDLVEVDKILYIDNVPHAHVAQG